MKKRLYLYCMVSILLNLVCHPIYANFFFNYTGPKTPFAGEFLLERISIDSIYLEGHNAAREHKYKGKIIHSSDGLTDTLYINNTIAIMSFYPNGKMKHYKTSNHFLMADMDEMYIYDNQGRIKEINGYYKDEHRRKKTYFYTNTGIDSILLYEKAENSFFKVYKEEIRYNSQGYDVYFYEYNNETCEYKQPISHNAIVRYVFDMGNKLVQTKSYYPNQIETDNFNSQNLFEYFNNGYKNIITYDFGPRYSYEFYYNEHNDLIEYFYRQWWNNSYWLLTDYFKYEYIDLSGVANNFVNCNNRIYSRDNNLIIESNNKSPVTIFSFTGKIIKQFIQEGTSEVQLSPGIYIVYKDGASYKVYIK